MRENLLENSIDVYKAEQKITNLPYIELFKSIKVLEENLEPIPRMKFF